MDRVVVVTGLMRSGTTVYRQLLDSSGVAFDVGEAFNVNTVEKTNFYKFWHATAASNITLAHPYSMCRIWKEFLERMREESGQTIIVVDAKKDFFPLLRVPQLNSDWPILPMLAEGARMVRVKRQNLFSQVISLELANQNNRWAVMNPRSKELPRLNGEQNDTWRAPKGRPQPIVLNEQTIVARLDELQKANEELDAVVKDRPRCTTIIYEEMFDGDGQWRQEIIDQSADILGISPKSFNRTPRLAKQNIYSNREIVANYDVVARQIGNSPHAWMVGHH